MGRGRMSGASLSVAKLHWGMDEMMKPKSFLGIKEWYLHVLPSHEIFGLAATGSM